MITTSELSKQLNEACNYEEKRKHIPVYCGWCGNKEDYVNGKHECTNCDEYFINEREIKSFVY